MNVEPDPAAVFAIAHSLWSACHNAAAADPNLNLSEAHNGMDQFMREAMGVATQFENWACRYINFAELDEPWPYLLQDHFGETCLQVLSPTEIAQFSAPDCLRISLRLGLPVKPDQGFPVPVDIRAPSPLSTGDDGFREFRIQTIREHLEDHDCAAFTAADDPYDPEYGPVFFSLYGIGEDHLAEHIADRPTHAQILALIRKLVPGLKFEGVD